MRRVMIVVCLVILSACSAKFLPLTQTDADRGAKKFPGVTLVELNEGQSIYIQHCNACHPYKKPPGRTEEEWNKVVPVMVGKVNKKAGGMEIDSTKQRLLLQYLVTMSKPAQ